MSYGITNVNQIIDKRAIENGCNELELSAKVFRSCAELLDDAAGILNKDALSVDNKTMQPTIQDVSDQIARFETAVCDITSQIRAVASEIYTAQCNELNAYNRRLQEEQERNAKQNQG